MAKGRTKTTSDESVVPAQPRSLRSRKREHLSEEISEPQDVKVTIHHQEPGGTNTAAVESTVLQCPQQESLVVSTQQLLEAEEPCPTKYEPVLDEPPADTANVMVEEQEGTKATNVNKNSQPQGFTAHTDNPRSEKGTTENQNSSQTCPDQCVTAILEESKRSGDTAVDEKKVDADEVSPCNLEKNQDTSLEEPSSMYIADVKPVMREAEIGLPAKKKRRMGMCGLTEKERNHFLRGKKHENEQKEPERVKMPSDNNAADIEAQEGLTSSPKPPSLPVQEGSISEQNEAATKLQSGNCTEDSRADMELQIAVTTSDGASTVCDPCCFVEMSCEADPSTEPDPEPEADPKLDLPTEERGEEVNDEEKLSAAEDQSSAIISHPRVTENEQIEDQRELEAVCMQMNVVPMMKNEKKEEFTCDEEVGDVNEAPTQNPSGEFNCGSVELCQAAVIPCGSEKNCSIDPEDEPGTNPSPVSTKHPLTGDSSDPCRPDSLDYVSDSQLNTIPLM
ncbi:uncharacterized protein LOC117816025 [Xyrichtys novacula]|uniref:Uncharacterized protein LOC117816025 n=1 Tax=Xyrichtys novacula TaxID=13765 RepID=A0AAV1EYS9_XYRNO|nr:uncharacterized protein LOC117816025 [Xyrichtys novacula]